MSDDGTKIELEIVVDGETITISQESLGLITTLHLNEFEREEVVLLEEKHG